MKHSFFKNVAAATVILSLIFIGCSSDSNSTPVDLCTGITCQNGGICDNGICDCPEGYSGIYCQTEVEPTMVSVDKIVVKQFPGSGSDIYIKLLRQTTEGFELIYESDTYFENASSPGNYTFDIIPAEMIVGTSTPHILSVVNYDPLGPDYEIGQTIFYPYEQGEGFHSVKTTTIGNVVADVYFMYIW
jgi:hypothetical protein